ncbi:tRNA (guanine26-N2/guanine27-N2)-dimethyltransferase [Enteropsectra breve]|nr:tRNA (guanine26-N2/guanine27-N2)-dimethyltransferase [Enteropsectra breve]
MPETIEENSAKIIKEKDTFFNPAQKLNRDLSIAAIKNYFPEDRKIRILSAMEATGLRGIRYLNEIPNASVYFNDICPFAVKTIQSNLEYNSYKEICVVKPNESLRDQEGTIFVTQEDCSVLMNKYHGYFDVIDIDPFGSCAQFVNDAFRAIKHNGLLCFTCTDKAALCANVNKCLVKYSTHIKRVYSKGEMPLRVLLSYISREFSKYGASIVPVVSLSVDFYIRVIVRVAKRAEKSVIEDNRYCFICSCLNKRVQDLKDKMNTKCDVCSAEMLLYGPFWYKNLHDTRFIEKMLQSSSVDGNDRLIGILKLMAQEIDEMFYYSLPELCSKIKVNSCKLRELMNALANEGYRVSLVHYDNNSVKTNAPLSAVNEMLAEKFHRNTSKYNFGENAEVTKLFNEEYHKGKIMSGMKPGALPTK